MDNEDLFFRILTWVLGLVVLLLVLFASVVIAESVKSDGTITYCYIEPNVAPELPIYNLYGYRPWRPDRRIASFKTLDEAIDFSSKMQCSVKGHP